MPEIKINHSEIVKTFIKHGWKGEVYRYRSDAAIHTISPDGSVFVSSLVRFEDYCIDDHCDDYGHYHHWENPKLIMTLQHAEILYGSLRFLYQDGSLPDQKGITIVNEETGDITNGQN